LSNKVELAQTLREIAQEPTHSLDEADLGRIIEIAEAHGYDTQRWISNRERDSYGSAGLTTCLGQIVDTLAWVNASGRFTPAEKQQVINRLADVAGLKLDDVDSNEGVATATGKGRKVRTVYPTDQTTQVLAAWLAKIPLGGTCAETCPRMRSTPSLWWSARMDPAQPSVQAASATLWTNISKSWA
jgi:integrase